MEGDAGFSDVSDRGLEAERVVFSATPLHGNDLFAPTRTKFQYTDWHALKSHVVAITLMHFESLSSALG